jgi:hypothetical protein
MIDHLTVVDWEHPHQLDLIIGFLVLIIKGFDDQIEIWS